MHPSSRLQVYPAADDLDVPLQADVALLQVSGDFRENSGWAQ
jgi:hypothetical protein